MATTIPFPFRAWLQAQHLPDPLNTRFEEVIEQYETALADEDKADDPEDLHAYTYEEETLLGALATLLDVPQTMINAYLNGRPAETLVP